MSNRMRKLITADPYEPTDLKTLHRSDQRWPSRWICHPDHPQTPFVTAYRCKFELEKDATFDIHVTADERYDLYVDGDHQGKGPERGDPKNWFYETYELSLKAGEHVIVARVWSLGDMGPMGADVVRPGFLLSPDVEFMKLLGTGVATWDVKILSGYQFTPGTHWLRWVGAQNTLDAAKMEWGFERGDGNGWKPAAVYEPGLSEAISDAFDYNPAPHLRFATLPAMLREPRTLGTARWAGDVKSWDTHLIPIDSKTNDAEQQKQWNALAASKTTLTIPPHAHRRVLFDLGDYYCGYPVVETSGGAGSLVRVFFAESLIELPDPPPDGIGNKGNRDAIENKLFHGIGDEFKPDGKPHRRFEPLWWRPGRYVDVYVETGDEPLTLHEISLLEDRYPLDIQSQFKSGDERFEKAAPIMRRALQICMHETYMDCPFYEQLMYIGDTRLQMLTTYALTRDERLPRKAVQSFARSRLPSGLTQSRFPSRITQIIPTFSLWWIGMIHDFALWRGDLPLIRSLMSNARNVIDFFLANLNSDGLLQAPIGWNFVDWVSGWRGGVPADGDAGVSGPLNWQLVYTLALMAELETWCGESQLAERCQRHASDLSAKASTFFWDDKRQLFSDDAAKKEFSEHCQCLALLSEELDADRAKAVGDALVKDQNLQRTTIYFTHYLFETYRQLGRPDKIVDRMKLWFDLPAQGFKTTPESPEPTRSDCHAWGAHPLYHYFASILGVRPGSLGFATVTIEPQLGPMGRAWGSLVHPKGMIEIDAEGDAKKIEVTVTLPAGVTGQLLFGGKTTPLHEGKQKVQMTA